LPARILSHSQRHTQTESEKIENGIPSTWNLKGIRVSAFISDKQNLTKISQKRLELRAWLKW
jgi:hypothetical protein